MNSHDEFTKRQIWAVIHKVFITWTLSGQCLCDSSITKIWSSCRCWWCIINGHTCGPRMRWTSLCKTIDGRDSAWDNWHGEKQGCEGVACKTIIPLLDQVFTRDVTSLPATIYSLFACCSRFARVHGGVNRMIPWLVHGSKSPHASL